MVSGWYGCGNTGDDAILAGIIETIRSIGIPSEVCALSYDPQDSSLKFGIDIYPHLPSGLFRGAASLFDGSLARTTMAIRRADLFVLGGGGFLSDWQREAPWLWLRQLVLARAMGTPTLLLGLGAGPFLTSKGKYITRKLLNGFADHITVRDERSRKWLLDIGVEREVITSGDPSLSLAPDDTGGKALLERLGLDEIPLVGINAIPLFSGKEWGQKQERYRTLQQGLSDLISYLSRDLGFHVLGIPFMNMDKVLLGDVTSSFETGACTVLDHDIEPRVLLSIFGRLEAFIGMRYHSLLFSALLSTPFYGLIYNHKGKELVRDLQMDPFAQELGDGTQADDRDLDIDEAKRAIERLLARRGEMHARLKENMAALTERERRNRRMLQQVMEQLVREK